MDVFNTYIVDDIDELWRWAGRVRSSTLLSQQSSLITKLTDHVTKHFRKYKIMWCKAKANRFFLIQCKICGGACYGTYPDGMSEPKSELIQKFAGFLGEALSPGATQV